MNIGLLLAVTLELPPYLLLMHDNRPRLRHEGYPERCHTLKRWFVLRAQEWWSHRGSSCPGP